MSFFDLEDLKGKPTRSKEIMPHLKLSKNMILRQFFWKTNKNWNSNGLMQILSNFSHSKVPSSIIWLRFSKKRFIIWLYHLVLHYILSSNKKFGIWINNLFFIFWCLNQTISPYFKSSSLLTNDFFINK
jgi:hypothetical protein